MLNMSVAYIEFGVKNSLTFHEKLVKICKFTPIAYKFSPKATQFVCGSRAATIVITEINKRDPTDCLSHCECDCECLIDGLDSEKETDDPFIVKWNFPENHEHPRESVFNVAFLVNDVDHCVRKVSQCGGKIVRPVTIVRDKNGFAKIAVIKSKAGNITHTLLERCNYHGVFLPGFHPFSSFSHCYNEHLINCYHVQTIQRVNQWITSINDQPSSFITDFDHVAIVCCKGTMEQIQMWYEKCLGLKRFKINRDDTEEDGLSITGRNIGLRLKALEYWKCAETGLMDPSKPDSVKIVLVESLTSLGPNQVDTFLQEHGGPGIQHVALHTSDISSVVADWKKDGLEFVEPPSTYYDEIDLKAIAQNGKTWNLLKENGILMDTEEDLEQNERCSDKTRFLLQKFTKPLFEKDTFFLELIQREGAVGFGSGNIRALWRAVRSYLEDKADIST